MTRAPSPRKLARHGDRFIVGFTIDVTPKATGHRFRMEEMALYTVRDGKIVREEFFYQMGI